MKVDARLRAIAKKDWIQKKDRICMKSGAGDAPPPVNVMGCLRYSDQKIF